MTPVKKRAADRNKKLVKSIFDRNADKEPDIPG